MNQLPIDIPLKNFHQNNGAKILPFAGFNMPINYKTGIINEHKNVRNHSGIFDVSHMGQILIENNESYLHKLEKYIPLQLKKLIKNRSHYSFLLNKDGGVIDDLIISNIDIKDKSYLYIVYNASRKKEDEEIFISCAPNAEKIYNKNCLFAIQGPDSINVLKNIIDIPNNMNFFDILISKYDSNEIIVSRSGYTGEDGFELSIPNEIAENLITHLLKNENTMLCGLGSRDSLRLEAGLSLYGHELNENITPIEAGLSWALDKKRLEDKNIIESKTLAETYVFNEADIDGSIVSSGCDHIVNGNFNKWIGNTDFDIAIPLRRKARVNNALIILKKRTKNTIDFFNWRLEMFYKLNENDRAWYGDQRSYESIFYKCCVMTKGVKVSCILGLHYIKGCKVLTIPYGGEVLGTNVDGQYFFPNALFYDYKGERKHQYQRGFIKAKQRIGK